MTDASPNELPPAAPGIVQRARDILLKPAETWSAIAAEPATVQSIYLPYVVILAALGPIAQVLGGQLFGISILGMTYHPPLVGALVSAILSYGLALASVFLLSLVIDALAPSFGGKKDPVQALKVAAYAGTAGWVGGILGLVPQLAIVGALFGLYGLYLLYVGLPVLMKAPQDKALGYTAVVVIVAIVLFVIVGAVVAAFAAPSFPVIR